MTRPWNPNKWLSPEDYARLSPLERKRLWRERGHERAVERHSRTYRPRAKRMPMWHWRLLTVMALVVGMPVARWIADHAPSGWSSQPALSASGQAPVRASFDQCKWGGGTNCVVDGDTIYLEGQKIRIAGSMRRRRMIMAAPRNWRWATARPPGCRSCSMAGP